MMKQQNCASWLPKPIMNGVDKLTKREIYAILFTYFNEPVNEYKSLNKPGLVSHLDKKMAESPNMLAVAAAAADSGATALPFAAAASPAS